MELTPRNTPSIRELLLTAVAVALAVWILITTIILARTGWVSIPVADDWDRWITLITDHYTPFWFFREHVDHRLVVPKLFFAVDHLAFHARGWFVIVCSFCLQALTGLMLWRMSSHASKLDATERWILAAAIAAGVFSAQQSINFIWLFQVQFPLVYCAATAALISLWNAAQQDSRRRALWIVGAIASATVATYSMANGILVWPMLLLAALWLRMSRRAMAAVAASAVLVAGAYFFHWHKSIPPVTFPPSERWPRVALFFFAHLGSPLFPLGTLLPSDNLQLAAAAILGFLLALALLAGFVMLWRRRDRFSSAQAMLLLEAVFLVATSASIAYGRADGALYDAFTPRYLTASYILWVCSLLAAWPALRRSPRLALYSVVCAVMLLGVAIHQRTAINTTHNREQMERLGEIAVVDGVTDPEPWVWLYHTPSITMDAIDYLRKNHLATFTEEWSHWPGSSLNGRFTVDDNASACKGKLEQVTPMLSTLKPGWKVSGWAWDNKAARPPHYVLLANADGVIAGVALTGFQGSNWNGYIRGQAGPVIAYVVEADDRSLCSIGIGQSSDTSPKSAVEPLTRGITRRLKRSRAEPLYTFDSLGPINYPATQKSNVVSGQIPIAVSGWALDGSRKAAAGGVDVVVDRIPYAAHYGISRTDVATHFGRADYTDSGFQLTFAPGQLTRGPHTVSIRVISRDGKSYEEGKQIRFTVN